MSLCIKCKTSESHPIYGSLCEDCYATNSEAMFVARRNSGPVAFVDINSFRAIASSREAMTDDYEGPQREAEGTLKS